MTKPEPTTRLILFLAQRDTAQVRGHSHAWDGKPLSEAVLVCLIDHDLHGLALLQLDLVNERTKSFPPLRRGTILHNAARLNHNVI